MLLEQVVEEVAGHDWGGGDIDHDDGGGGKERGPHRHGRVLTEFRDCDRRTPVKPYLDEWAAGDGAWHCSKKNRVLRELPTTSDG
jgi:hypothetical protein